jgi:hypothetical protein
MADEPRPDDPLHIWQNQPSETPKMPLQQLEEIHRQKATALRTKTRWAALGNLLATIVFSGFVLIVVRYPFQFVTSSLAIVWTLIVNLPSVRRAWSRTPAGDAAMLSGLEFYRRQIEYRLTQFRRPWLTFLGPILLALTGLLAPAVVGVLHKPALAVNMVPFLVLLAVWAVFASRIVHQQVDQLKLELEELDALERWQRS